MYGKTKKPMPKKTPKSPYGKVVQKTTKKSVSYSPNGRKAQCMIGEVLAGIALVNSAHKQIKQLVSNVSDIGGLAKHIDQLFEGEKQIQKDRSKASSPLSMKNVAEETINARLAQEQMQEIATLVNLRFGPGTWQGIINERAKRIQEQKEHDRAQRALKRKEQEEFAENAKLLGIVFMSIISLMGIVVGLFVYNSSDN